MAISTSTIDLATTTYASSFHGICNANTPYNDYYICGRRATGYYCVSWTHWTGTRRGAARAILFNIICAWEQFAYD
jgi:hypothetical protein